jgi:hypothetical protein
LLGYFEIRVLENFRSFRNALVDESRLGFVLALQLIVEAVEGVVENILVSVGVD